MPRGILYVESRPSAAGREAEYHAWYNTVHLAEVVAVDGIVAARRYGPVSPQDDGPFVAIYELEADDLNSVMTGLMEAAGRGAMNMSDALGMDPAPTMRLMELLAEYEPAAEVPAGR